MRRSPVIALLLIAVFVALGRTTHADGDDAHTMEYLGAAEVTGGVSNEYCPVMPEEKVDPEIHVEYEGKAVYLCCKMCRKDFLESPEQYLATLPQFASNGSGQSGDAPETQDESNHAHGEEDTSSKSTPHGMELAHDHAKGHESSQDLSARVIRFGGKFHPVVVHFPIALTIIALLAELLYVFRREELFRAAGRFCIAISALSALAAASLGWAAASTASYPSLELTLAFHRWLGTGSALLVIGCAILGEMATRRENRMFYRVYFVALLICSILVGVVGHLGATLIYGPDHFGF